MGDAQSPAPSGEEGPSDARIRTFLIADIRGYTLFTQRRGDEAGASLAGKFAAITRDVIETHAGTLLELRGDEALCVFTSTREALGGAVALQRRFVEETLAEPDVPLTVGIGLDAGEAVPVQGGYRGAALNVAARLCAQARPGEILATREVTHLARRIQIARYEDVGARTLKGIPEPVVVMRVVPEGEDPVERLRPFAPPRPGAGEPRRRRWLRLGAAALVVVLVAASIPFLLSRAGHRVLDIGTNAVARMDADAGDFELATAIGHRPGASAIGYESLWVAQPDRGVITRLALGDGSVIDASIRVGDSPAGIAVGDGSVWVTNAGEGTVSRVDPETNEATQTLRAGTGPAGIAFGDGALWVADTLGARLLRIDPVTGASRSVAVAGQPTGVAFTPGAVWVSVAPDGISRIDPVTMSVTFRKTVGNGPTALLAAFASIWVANQLDGTVSRLDPLTGGIQATIPVGEGPNALADAGGSLWVANEFADSITSIDVDRNAVRQTLPVGAAAASIAADGAALWLAVGASTSAHRGGRLAIASSDEAPSTLDPAFASTDVLEGQILSLTNDGLLTFKKVGGAGGSTLVPDLAAALPQVSPDGLSYRFVLREGLRYSTGEPVRPEDVRYGLQRALTLQPDLAELLFGSLEGVESCAGGATACDLSRAVEVGPGWVTFHLHMPDPDLPFKLAQPAAYPVPASIPIQDQGRAALPATGPYLLSQADDSTITLVRNPEFTEWSAAAQPDGFVDEILWRFDQDAADAFDAVRAGDTDLLTSGAPPEDLAGLTVQHPDRIIRWPLPAAFYLGFDMRTPPFDDVRVRQALNYALDRGRIVELAGGMSSHRISCQIFPPDIEGYEPFCPYTIGPESGVWSAPDVDRARALVEEAGAAGEEVTIWAAALDPVQNAIEVMRYVSAVLEDLGLRPHLEVVDDFDRYIAGVTDTGPQLYMMGWVASYAFGASGWIDEGFRCSWGGSAPVLCTDELAAEIASARDLEATDPAAANDAWMRIEHGLVENAVWAPLTNAVSTIVVSDRVGDVQVHGQWGILLSRVWVQ